MNDILRKLAHTGGEQAYLMLIGAVSLYFTARWLGPDGRGVVVAVLSWIGLYVSFGNLSLGQVATTIAARHKGDSWLPDVLPSFLVATLLLSGIGVFAGLLFYHYSNGSMFGEIRPEFLLLGLVLIPFNIATEYIRNLLSLIGKIELYNYSSMIGRTLSLMIVVLAIGWFGVGAEGVLVATAVASIVVATMGSYLLLNRAKESLSWPPNNTLSPLKELFVGGLKLTPAMAGTVAINYSDILLVNYYLTATATGLYQLATQFVNYILVVAFVANTIFLGRVGQVGPKQAWEQQRVIGAWIMGLVVLIATLAGLTCSWWLVWFAGDAFSGSIPIFQWRLLAVVGTTGALIMSSQWLGRGYLVAGAVFNSILAVLNVIGNIILIPKYGVIGAVWSTIFVSLMMIVFHAWMLKKCEMDRIHSVE